MSIAFTAASHAAFLPKPAPFFVSPEPAGRRIVCGFSYLQRINKSAATDIWFPSSLHGNVAARVREGDASVLDEFQVEWAAVRQFELLQEAGNLAIEDLEFMDFKRAFLNLMKMRAGGYRVTVITLGRYGEGADDDLRILDARLQDEITRLIHMLYLEEQSALCSRERGAELERRAWRSVEALPHVAGTLGAAQVFGRAGDKRLSLKTGFFRLLDMMPQRHIAHDVAIGLTLPDASKEKNWVYLAQGEHQFPVYMRLLSDVFGMFDCVSLGALHERHGAASEVMPVMHHMRGHGGRLNPVHEARNRAAALFLQKTAAAFSV